MFIHDNVPSYVELPDQTINGKRWYQVPSGKWYASATTILGGTQTEEKRKGLDDWRHSLGVSAATKETQRCADRGTAVHAMIEKYLNNVEDPTKGFGLLEQRMFNQTKTYLNQINHIRALEIPLYSNDLKIAGRVDCVAEYRSVLSIVDFKTSNNIKNDKMVEDYKLQVTAYALMYEELFDVWIDNFIIIMAVEKGMIPMVFEGNIESHIEPLIKRISTFYKNNKYMH